MAQAFTTLFCQVVAMGRGLNTIRKFPSILVRIIHHLMPEQASGKDHFIPDHTARSRHSTPEHTERTEHLILDPKTRIRHLTPDHTTSVRLHMRRLYESSQYIILSYIKSYIFKTSYLWKHNRNNYIRVSREAY